MATVHAWSLSWTPDDLLMAHIIRKRAHAQDCNGISASLRGSGSSMEGRCCFKQRGWIPQQHSQMDEAMSYQRCHIIYVICHISNAGCELCDFSAGASSSFGSHCRRWGLGHTLGHFIPGQSPPAPLYLLFQSGSLRMRSEAFLSPQLLNRQGH